VDKLKDVKSPLRKISGSWCDKIFFDDVENWSLATYVPSRQINQDEVLPSDWRHREDLIWLKYECMPEAQ
jgi:hypothetical protein